MSAPPTTATAPRAWMRDPRRWAFAGAGLVAVGLGWIGIFVPGLPTTVFLIIASYCFARSCPWLEERLLRVPVFAPYMQALDTGRGLSPAAARRAWASLWTSLLFSLAILRAAGRLPLWLGATIVGAGLVGTATIAVLTPVPAADCPRRRAKPGPPIGSPSFWGRGSALTDDTEGAQVPQLNKAVSRENTFRPEYLRPEPDAVDIVGLARRERRHTLCSSKSPLPPTTDARPSAMTAAQKHRRSTVATQVAQPESLAELFDWVRRQSGMSSDDAEHLVDAIVHVMDHHERLWQQSKADALQAMSVGFADRMRRMREELSARDTTVSSITRYFETLVADLTDRADRDPKTRLMNFRRFSERLEAFLALEQRGSWCAVGLVDIRSFKQYNDVFGHALGDRVIDRVARLLREQVRANDVLAQDALTDGWRELHARFGGDEFCFCCLPSTRRTTRGS